MVVVYISGRVDSGQWTAPFRLVHNDAEKNNQKHDVQLSPTLVAVHLGAELNAAQSFACAHYIF